MAIVDTDMKAELGESFTEGDKNKALQKLKDAAEIFDRSNPLAPKLDSFQSKLNPQTFKDLIRRVLAINLSAKESGALVKYFSEDELGNISGQKFILTFIQMGVDERVQKNIARRERQRKIEQDAEDERKRKLKLERIKNEKLEMVQYSEEDLTNALKKLQDAAISCDPAAPVIVKGFEVSYLSLPEFKHILSLAFGLRFSPEEFSAIVVYFDKQNTKRIVSQQFLTSFFKMGFEERARRKAVHMEEQRAKREFKKQEHIRKIRKIEEALERGVDFNFTETDEASAFAKIADAARYYDKTHTSASSLDGFSGAFLKPGAFRDLLRRTLNVNLTGAEVGALVKHFDEDDTKMIPCAEFMQYFFKLGSAEKNREYMSVLAKRKAAEKMNEKGATDRAAGEAARQEDKISWKFSEADLDSALNKLSSAARDYDPLDSATQSEMTIFDVQSMTPAAFREAIKRVFGIKLTGKESGALAKSFQKGNEKNVECTLFLVKFTSLVTIEKEKIRQNIRTSRKKLEEKHKVQQTAKQRLLDAKVDEAVDLNFTKDDFKIAMDKIRTGICNYNQAHAPTITMESAFSAAYTSVAEFREQLKIIFNIVLSPKELGSVMKLFIDDDYAADEEVPMKFREISNAVFLQYVYRVQREHKAKVRQSLQQKEKDEMQKERELREKKEMVELKELTSKLQFGESHEVSLVRKLRRVAATFVIDSSPYVEQLQLVKDVGLPARMFRDIFSRVFHVRLTYPEVGALMNALDDNGLGTVDVTRLITGLFRMGRIEERVAAGELKAESITLACLSAGGVLTESTALVAQSPSRSSFYQHRQKSVSTSPRAVSEALTSKTLTQSWLFPHLSSFHTSQDDNEPENEEDNEVPSAALGANRELKDDFAPLSFRKVARSDDSNDGIVSTKVVPKIGGKNVSLRVDTAPATLQHKGTAPLSGTGTGIGSGSSSSGKPYQQEQRQRNSTVSATKLGSFSPSSLPPKSNDSTKPSTAATAAAPVSSTRIRHGNQPPVAYPESSRDPSPSPTRSPSFPTVISSSSSPSLPVPRLPTDDRAVGDADCEHKSPPLQIDAQFADPTDSLLADPIAPEDLNEESMSPTAAAGSASSGPTSMVTSDETAKSLEEGGVTEGLGVGDASDGRNSKDGGLVAAGSPDDDKVKTRTSHVSKRSKDSVVDAAQRGRSRAVAFEAVKVRAKAYATTKQTEAESPATSKKTSSGKLNKKQKEKSTKEEPVFFFPALLSSAPVLSMSLPELATEAVKPYKLSSSFRPYTAYNYL